MEGNTVHMSSRKTRQAGKPSRRKRIETRVSDAELEAIDRFCEKAGVSRSEAMRWVAHGHARVIKETRNADVERLASETRLIGNNVNQIARKLNRVRGLSPASAESLKAALERVSKALDSEVRAIEALDATLSSSGADCHSDD